MKALSIKQPWASLIVHGIKDIENRTWKTHFRGRIYIHSSGKGVQNFVFNQQQHEALSTINTDNMNMPYSAIIGEVDIVNCVVNHKSIWAEANWPYEKPIYNWVLANAKLYNEPILNVKGKLSFWEFKK
ncbi:ASCH domain-containing protein [Tenacibaculum maritimum]|nr:ASCH domain-containing protein [Tenacibaculum maritimum]MDB0602340.1 ASCH domain-containing protein [Tenacibaculum maritimum]MDB0613499.1 ASCH domain-containing protein [Tenacibaculum maritimum]